MKRVHQPAGRFGFVLGCAWIVTFTGCTTYVQQSPPRTVYVPAPVEQPAPPVYVLPPQATPVVVIVREDDFYQPLTPYGQWVMVPSHGRCWRPVRVETGWRPYSNGHWQRTDAGWYWASEEPWGWATYHYGRWVMSARFGWVWVPQTQWAPAWVAWREGEGYVGWAPLPPTARFGRDGVMDERDLTPESYVFVEDRRMLEPVRPTTVIVNNVTIVNKTKNITKLKVVNKTVINEGPRTESVERVSGRKVQAAASNELRNQDETKHVARQRQGQVTDEQRTTPAAAAVRGGTPASTQPSEAARVARDERQRQVEAERKAAQDAKAEAERAAALRKAEERNAEIARAEALKNLERQQKAEAERLEAMRKAEQQKAEAARVEAMRQAQQERKAEAERAAAFAKAQQEKERIARLEAQKAEQARLEKEKAAKKAAEELEQAQKKLAKEQAAEKAAAEKAAKKKAAQERAKKKPGEPEPPPPVVPPPGK